MAGDSTVASRDCQRLVAGDSAAASRDCQRLVTVTLRDLSPKVFLRSWQKRLATGEAYVKTRRHVMC